MGLGAKPPEAGKVFMFQSLIFDVRVMLYTGNGIRILLTMCSLQESPLPLRVPRDAEA